MAMTEAEYLAKASDPTTTGDELQALWDEAGIWGFPLGNTTGRRIQGVIVQNPNLPLSLVRECFGELATELALNPALPLLCLEIPNLAKDAPEETVLRLLRRAELPKVIVEILCQHQTRAIADAARLHVACHPETMEEHVRQELLMLPPGRKSTLKQLHDRCLLPGWLAEAHSMGERSEPILPEWFPSGSGQKKKTVEQLKAVGYWWAILDHKQASAKDRAEAYANSLAQKSSLSAQETGLGMVVAIAACTDSVSLHNFVLERLWFRRLGAALNPQLTEKDRKRLVNDANAIVRAVARDTKLRDRIMEYEPNGEL
jgi:hypothetical protein